MYHRHFERFRGNEVHVLEIGIYSGGSLDMWHEYFGHRWHVYGVDTQEECLRYRSDSTTVFIGDQADRDFWRRFRTDVPKLDVVVDDGGHQPHQQATSLEELLPHPRPGGVYVVEDLHGVGNRFATYVSGLVEALNAYRGIADHANPERRKVSEAAGFQSSIESIHAIPTLRSSRSDTSRSASSWRRSTGRSGSRSCANSSGLPDADPVRHVVDLAL